MLLLDDEDELPALPNEEEVNLQLQLGADGLLAIDSAILSHAGPHWLKTASVVHDAISSASMSFDDACVDLHVRRVIELVQANVLEAKGNPRKPRWSEIRIPHRHS